jgi:probable phosphoglycerate mutase
VEGVRSAVRLYARFRISQKLKHNRYNHRMDLYLIRHGNNPTPGAAGLDPDLNEIGVAQAHRLGARLTGEGIERIYASNLRRALHTAQIVQVYVPVPLDVRPALREIDMGRLRRQTWAEIEADLPGYHAEWSRHAADLPYPEGECGADVLARALPVVDEILASGVQRAALVVHGGVIRSLLCAFLGLGQEQRFQFGAPLENTSVSIVRWDEKKARYFLHTFNDSTHLA